MKSQFLKPLDDVSLSLSASSTVLVPKIEKINSYFGSTVRVCVCVCARAHLLTCWRGECNVQVAPPRVLDAGLHLHVFQRVDCVLLTLAGLGGNFYGDLARCLQLPVG